MLFYFCIKSYLEDVPVPVGRGAVRGRRQVDIEHFRAPRPLSSLEAKGKQGMILS